MILCTARAKTSALYKTSRKPKSFSVTHKDSKEGSHWGHLSLLSSIDSYCLQRSQDSNHLRKTTYTWIILNRSIAKTKEHITHFLLFCCLEEYRDFNSYVKRMFRINLKLKSGGRGKPNRKIYLLNWIFALENQSRGVPTLASNLVLLVRINRVGLSSGAKAHKNYARPRVLFAIIESKLLQSNTEKNLVYNKRSELTQLRIQLPGHKLFFSQTTANFLSPFLVLILYGHI